MTTRLNLANAKWLATSSSLAKLLGFATLVLLGGCLSQTFKAPQKLASTNPAYVKNGNMVPARVLNLGHDTYLNYCMQCHGMSGQGNGPASPGMSPQPRNFTEGVFKFVSAKSGDLPTDEDLKQTIRYGLRGTQMLPWDLSDERLDALIQYLKTFAPQVWTDATFGTAWASHPNPWKGKETEAIVLGMKVYHGGSSCYACHAAYVSNAEINQYSKELSGAAVGEVRENPNMSILQDSSFNHKIMPPDFTKSWIKSMRTHPTTEEEIADIYRTIGSGVGGTSMPAWEGTFSSNPDPAKQMNESHDRQWALAYYLYSLDKLKFDSGARKKFFEELNAKRAADVKHEPQKH